MDPSRAARLGAELGTNCTGDGVEGTGGAGDEENSMKPVNIKIEKKKKLIPCVKYILTAMHVCFKHYGTHHS
jgi:hypothetical protein